MRAIMIICCMCAALHARERACDFHPDSIGYLIDGCLGKRLIERMLRDSVYRAALQERYGCTIDVFSDTTNPILSPSVRITYFTQEWTFTRKSNSDWAIGYESRFDSNKAAQFVFDQLLPRARKRGRFVGIKDSVYIFARADGTYVMLGVKRGVLRAAHVAATVYYRMR
ncbi:MAG: hypothetical protein KatS3mg038_2993 [Candidatus Kapaibacterium sp.]|nr:MAG: hypothetical protein KatS3mg038_2993 [Candidatus Kapabacteria bacterium]